MKTSIPNLPTGDVLVYKFGCRLDDDCLPVVNHQITLARRMYNDLVAEMRKAVDARATREVELGGQPAQAVMDRIHTLNEAFEAAKSSNDEDGMKSAAEARRREWPALADVLKAVRTAHNAELRVFLARIGKNSECTTYQIRGRYVAEGLGWATANQVLDSALQAFQSTIKKGQAPRFAKGAEITRDTLALQFTAAGGVAADKLLSASHNEIKLSPPARGYGQRRYGEFSMRMGAAKANTWANGTWQAHRPIPDGAHVAGVTLVREKIGSKFAWNLQLLVKLKEPKTASVNAVREPLAALHLGWSADSTGRCIGAIASAADAGLAELIQLPDEIEPQLARSSAIKADRDSARDTIVPIIKSVSSDVVGTWPEDIQEEFRALKRLPAAHIAASRLHRLWWMLQKSNLLSADLDAFTLWRHKDRLNHQAEVGLARGARHRRKDFYRTLALRQCQRFEAILLDQPDLKVAAQKVDEKSGDRNELGRKARSGRVVAALHEYVEALKWAAARCGTTLIEVEGSTASVCSSCGAEGLKTVDETQHQQQECPSCGAVHDRKRNAAAVVFQAICADAGDLAMQARQQQEALAVEASSKKLLKQAKVQEARRTRASQARALSADQQ